MYGIFTENHDDSILMNMYLEQMVSRYSSVWPLISLLLVSCSTSYQGEVRLPESGSEHPSPQTLTLPELDPRKSYAIIHDQHNDTLHLQYLKESIWTYLDPGGLSGTGRLIQSELNRKIKIHVDDSTLTVHLHHKPVLSYQMAIRNPPADKPDYYQRSGFIHPVYTPDGRIVTDDFPDGHLHQHGVFSAWVNTVYKGEKVDFWNQQHQTGTVIFDSLISMREGPVFAEFKTRQLHLAIPDGDTSVVLQEYWTVRVYNLEDIFLWDIEVRQQNISSEPLEILPHPYGGMAFRGSREWNDTSLTKPAEFTGQGRGSFRTSNSLGRIEANHTRPEWVQMYGLINNSPASLTVLQRTENTGYPQWTRIHPSMPYFCFFPFVEEGTVMYPADQYQAAYRVMVSNDTTSVPEKYLSNIRNIGED